MNFDLSENQELFRATVERFCGGGDVATRHARRRHPGGIDRDAWSELAGLGLVALAATEADGGLGGSLADCAVVARALGQGLAVEPWLECAFLPARLLAGDTLLESVLSGDRLATLAWAEPGRRFGLEAVATVAGAGRLSGEKTFVSCGAAADLFLVTARHQGGTAVFAVPRDAAGVTVTPYAAADGSEAALLSLENVVVNAPLGTSLAAVIDDARILAAAEIAGLAQRLFDDTLAYVKTREQFGQPIGRFQVIQHRLVDAYARVEAMQSAVLRALLKPDTPPAAVKAFVAEEAQWVGQQAVQLYGGMGMTDELPVGHALKRIITLSKLFGDTAGGLSAMAKAA